MTDLLVRNIGRLLTMTGPPPAAADQTPAAPAPLSAMIIVSGKVVWAGPERDLPPGPDVEELDAEGACVVPGFVDAHTHLPFAGNRRADFVGRLSGEPYSPAGIHSTVAATRAAAYDDLVASARARVATMRANGTTTVEVKSGYGLTPDDELRLLDVAAQVSDEVTYLGAHAVPPGTDRAAYVAEVVATLPAAKQHGAQWCDVFCDEGAFTVTEARHVLTAARDAGLGLRIHAEQIARTGAAELAAELGCASADHLDRLDEAGARALAAAGVAGVLLPACTLTLGSNGWDAWRHLRDAGATVALGTDCNPGTSWCESMPYVIQLACLAYRMPVEAAFHAATRGAARALRRDDVGHLGEGARGDVVVLDAEHEADVVAHLGAPAVRHTVVGGSPLVS